jgi:hypothetical protein
MGGRDSAVCCSREVGKIVMPKANAVCLYRLMFVLLLTALLPLTGCADKSRTFASRDKAFISDLSTDLQALIDQTPDNGVVRIPKGRYTINHGLVIKGRSHLSILADVGTQILLTDTDQDVLTITDSHQIRVFNVLMRHVTPMKQYECHGGVISISGSRKVVIANSELNGCGAVGISARDTQDLTIEHCYIHNNSFNALYFSDIRGLRLWSNVITANANTLQLYGVDDMQMSDNIITDNSGYWRTPIHKPGLLEWSPKPRLEDPTTDPSSKSR